MSDRVVTRQYARQRILNTTKMSPVVRSPINPSGEQEEPLPPLQSNPPSELRRTDSLSAPSYSELTGLGRSQGSETLVQEVGAARVNQGSQLDEWVSNLENVTAPIPIDWNAPMEQLVTRIDPRQTTREWDRNLWSREERGESRHIETRRDRRSEPYPRYTADDRAVEPPVFVEKSTAPAESRMADSRSRPLGVGAGAVPKNQGTKSQSDEVLNAAAARPTQQLKERYREVVTQHRETPRIVQEKTPSEIHLSTEMKTVINLAVVQAYDSYTNSLKEELTDSLRAEVRKNFLEFIGEINQTVRERPPLEERSPPRRREAANLQLPSDHQQPGRMRPPKVRDDESWTAKDVPEPYPGWRTTGPGRGSMCHDQDRDRYGMDSNPRDWNRSSIPQPTYGYRAPIKIDRWGIKFDGNPELLTAEDFIFRLETLQGHYGCPWPEILRDLHLLLSGPAYEWYWQFQQTYRSPDWPMLKEALLQRYRNPKSDLEIMRDLMDRKQGVWESTEDFFSSIHKMRSRLRMQLPEVELVRILKRNLNERIGRLVYPQAVYSLDQLRMACRDAEDAFPCSDRMNRHARQPMGRYNANELAYMEEEAVPIEENLAAFQYSGNRPRNNREGEARSLICWNCKVPGHTFMDCPSTERNIFCYKCGCEGVITPKCRKCHPENSGRNATSMGEAHSSQSPQMNLGQK